ncbi:transcription antitermination factor NusB [Soehngenia longivitae]|uniref:Transcription antitermination protein NusB n=1 Tax=Soehngenia longivitae TaxID=2562294 RepID=A0A4Z0D5E2_9FIRM|nr:transcription antitermination factor NusB [Soehngenia longivitae]TFZ39753.1 transcription antitermination factor NusB [Soehngenia longivitae]
MGRKQTREALMQLIYQMDLNKNFSKEEVINFLDNFDMSDCEIGYLQESAYGVIDNLENINKLIEKYTEGWTLDRLPKVDLSILRIAFYEIIYREDIPVEVSINEAIEIAKKYSTPDAFKYINGVLGSFVRAKD